MTQKKWFYPSLIFLSVCIFYLQIIIGKAFFGWDILDYHYPYLYETINSYREWNFLWTDKVLSGYPIFADPQAAISYPFNFILALIKGNPGFIIIELQLILHFILAGIFTFFYGKKIGLAPFSSYVSSIIFIFGGFMATHTQHYGTINAITWLPLILLCIENAYSSRRKYFYIVLAGSLYGMSILAGHVQTSLNMGYLILLYLLWKKLYKKKMDLILARSVIIELFLLYSISLLIALIQIIPTAELMMNSPRAQMTLDGSMAANLNPVHLISLVLPFFFGKYGYTPSWFTREIVESHLYLGLVTLFLFVVGLLIFSSRNREKEKQSIRDIIVFWITISFIYLLMAFGGETILHYINYYLIPGYNKLRRSYNFYAVVTFGVSIVAAFGVHYLDKLGEEFLIKAKRNISIVAFFLVCLLLAFYVILSIKGQAIEISTIINNLIISIVIVLLIAFSLKLYLAKFINHKRLKIFLSVILLFELFTFNANQIFNSQRLDVKTVFTQSALYGEHLEFIDEIKSKIESDNSGKANKILYLGFPATMQNQSMLADLENIYSYNPMRVNGYDQFLNSVFPMKNESELGSLVNYDSPMFNILGVRYIVANKTYLEANNLIFPAELFDTIGTYNGGKYIVFENKNVLPEAFISYNVKSQTGDVTADDFTDDPYRILLSNGREIQSSVPAEIIDLQKINKTRYSVSVNMKSDGAIYINKTYYNGWIAIDNGIKKDMQKANGAFLGLELEKGKHNIIVEFEPKTYYVSATISITTFIAVVIFCVYSQFVLKRRKSDKVRLN
ncbi:YfhO family protein [Paenibacillus sp. MER TA 81-3]|uniref:YfhO family protein n=1 Tax=Paenibacillus sp. MER TA 81-3 TaxID=2939573 RepID=UPI0020417E40|nr:YfhO family protein [Paenibacillus sp. MER TA 81-3]MCM3338823.1 YfhO family protein [Paenibacillus sp. MER TA 81-3]